MERALTKSDTLLLVIPSDMGRKLLAHCSTSKHLLYCLSVTGCKGMLFKEGFDKGSMYLPQGKMTKGLVRKITGHYQEMASCPHAALKLEENL